jgi:hypothetical protein
MPSRFAIGHGYESFQIKNANEWSHRLPMSNLSLIHLLLVTTIVVKFRIFDGFWSEL